MAGTFVILPHGRAMFRRTMRDENGVALKDKDGADRVLTFTPGQPVELSAEEMEAVRNDIGAALQIAKLDKDASPKPKMDSEATAKFAEDTKKRRDKELADRSAAKSHAKPDAPHKAAPVASHPRKDIESKGK